MPTAPAGAAATIARFPRALVVYVRGRVLRDGAARSRQRMRDHKRCAPSHASTAGWPGYAPKEGLSMTAMHEDHTSRLSRE
jgi:hypothetical protein